MSIGINMGINMGINIGINIGINAGISMRSKSKAEGRLAAGVTCSCVRLTLAYRQPLMNRNTG
jgi:hypothetical protein